MAMTYLADFAFAFLIMAVSAAIYAIKEAPPAGFYFGALLSAIAAPLVPLALVYLLIVPLVSLIRPLRSKNAVMVIGGFVGIAFGLAINLYMQTSMSKMQDPAWVLANFAGPDSLLAKLGAAYPPAFLAWKSMTSGGLLDPLFGLAGLALGLGFAALVAIGLGGPYAKSLLGFDEMRIKRVAATKGYFERSFRRGGELRALFLREWRLMNREPVYFMNGPFIVLLMPVFLAVGLFVVAQKPDAIAALGPLLQMKDEPWLMLAAAGFGAFLGSSTSITCTALSRDAKALRYLKALPLSYRGFMLAKFLHGLAFGAIGAAIGGIGLCAIMGLSVLDAASAFLIGLAFSAFASIAGLWLDTANPRTDWDTPMAALKQNPNAMIVILGVMGAIGGLGAASAFLGWGKLAFFAAYFGFFSAATAALLAAYPKYAQRRLEAIEL
jgi:ABC-2 type transport system permease protein